MCIIPIISYILMYVLLKYHVTYIKLLIDINIKYTFLFL